jgi:hypothetical protein
MASRQEITERLRRESYAKRATALREAAQKQASNSPISAAAGASSGGGGGTSSSYPDRVSFSVGGEVAGFACNTKDMYGDSDTPIYYGPLFGDNYFLYWNGSNWGLDNDLVHPFIGTGPTTKNSLYGTYTNKDGSMEVIAYSGDLSKECPALPSGETSSTISSGRVAWAWDGLPIKTGPDEFEVAGKISGYSLDPPIEGTLAGSFILAFDSKFGTWSIRNNGLTLGSFTVDVLDIPTASTMETGDDPITDTIGSFDEGSVRGIVIYRGA